MSRSRVRTRQPEEAEKEEQGSSPSLSARFSPSSSSSVSPASPSRDSYMESEDSTGDRDRERERDRRASATATEPKRRKHDPRKEEKEELYSEDVMAAESSFPASNARSLPSAVVPRSQNFSPFGRGETDMSQRRSYSTPMGYFGSQRISEMADGSELTADAGANFTTTMKVNVTVLDSQGNLNSHMILGDVHFLQREYGEEDGEYIERPLGETLCVWQVVNLKLMDMSCRPETYESMKTVDCFFRKWAFAGLLGSSDVPFDEKYGAKVDGVPDSSRMMELKICGEWETAPNHAPFMDVSYKSGAKAYLVLTWKCVDTYQVDVERYQRSMSSRGILGGREDEEETTRRGTPWDVPTKSMIDNKDKDLETGEGLVIAEGARIEPLSSSSSSGPSRVSGARPKKKSGAGARAAASSRSSSSLFPVMESLPSMSIGGASAAAATENEARIVEQQIEKQRKAVDEKHAAKEIERLNLKLDELRVLAASQREKEMKEGVQSKTETKEEKVVATATSNKDRYYGKYAWQLVPFYSMLNLTSDDVSPQYTRSLRQRYPSKDKDEDGNLLQPEMEEYDEELVQFQRPVVREIDQGRETAKPRPGYPICIGMVDNADSQSSNTVQMTQEAMEKKHWRAKGFSQLDLASLEKNIHLQPRTKFFFLPKHMLNI